MTQNKQPPANPGRFRLDRDDPNTVMLGVIDSRPKEEPFSLRRGAGLAVVWPQLIALAVIGSALFGYALARFRATIGTIT